MNEEKKIFDFKIHLIDEGFCRIVYKVRIREKFYLYSLQEEFHDQPLVLYKNSFDEDYCEPEYPIKLKKDIEAIFERPTGTSKLEQKAREWIDANTGGQS